jgi:hypothetical protein
MDNIQIQVGGIVNKACSIDSALHHIGFFPRLGKALQAVLLIL